MFICSFFTCWATCLINVFVQTPPFYYLPIDVATVYFHAIRLHMWVFWRNFVKEQHLKVILAVVQIRSHKEVMHISKVCSRAMLLAEVLMISLGLLVFPQPAIEHYDSESGSQSTFSAVHAFLMWLAIPQHVSTVVCSIVLYFFICRLHKLDVENTEAVVWDEGLLPTNQTGRHEAANTKAALKTTGEAVEAVQERLSHTCRRIAVLWYHQIIYAVVVLCMVHSHLLSAAVSTGQEKTFRNRELMFNLLYDVWHGIMGALLFTTALIIPAIVTGKFIAMPRVVFMGLRKHGVEIEDMDRFMYYLDKECVGYRISYIQVRAEMIGQVVSVMMVLSSIYATWYVKNA
eukprot:gnl/TRDRNA2_/TRDRNA2_175364_c0_seq1.p1 gnl/TRDRNA2_/TRDRNA2_175364_c0~~gnl/TRDRNA2_/TRDRNA2_175364_c0_seq1.p1  ORF type:complete len:345 (-),score=36.73 gnl/TRDRNA2_/TRDRNA2_175364_c0_seq1:169-1203(-)